jgi:hypothetical protein
VSFSPQVEPNTDVLIGESPYGYVPSKGVCLTAIVLFSVSTALHVLQVIYYSIRRRKAVRSAANDQAVVHGEPNYWFILLTLVPGGFLEIVGWAGRYWSSQNVLNIQVCWRSMPASTMLNCL